jgi:hypothetical protein
MKKHFTTLAVLLIAVFFNANAQLGKGNVLIGGDLANFDLGLNEGSTFTMTLTPKVAWFIQDNVAVGGFADLGLATAKGAGTSFNYGVGALGRYYFPAGTASTTATTRFLLEGNAGIEGVNTAGGNSTNGLGLGIGPGITHFITPSVALEALLKYNGIVGFGSSATSSRLQLNLGFQVYLPGSRVSAEASKMK